jgi:hypothetical protein
MSSRIPFRKATEFGDLPRTLGPLGMVNSQIHSCQSAEVRRTCIIPGSSGREAYRERWGESWDGERLGPLLSSLSGAG